MGIQTATVSRLKVCSIQHIFPGASAGITWIRLFVNRTRLGVTEESFKMLLTDDNEVSIPVSSCVTVATHSSLAEAAVILIIC